MTRTKALYTKVSFGMKPMLRLREHIMDLQSGRANERAEELREAWCAAHPKTVALWSKLYKAKEPK